MSLSKIKFGKMRQFYDFSFPFFGTKSKFIQKNLNNFHKILKKSVNNIKQYGICRKWQQFCQIQGKFKKLFQVIQGRIIIKQQKEMRTRQRLPLLNGKYQLLGKQLGEGGLGKVFLAENIETGERVAVKHTLKSLQESQLVRELARNEVQTLLKLKGAPHILQIRDHFQKDNKQFIVTELCQGGTLSALIKKRLLTYNFIVFTISTLLQAYMTIQKFNILHRDLKPSNILFTKKGQLKVADFGFATFISNLKKQGTLSIGSSLYMPPQSLSQYHYSSKGDIWAIGVIFYQMVTGKHPWYEKTKPKIFQKIILEPIQVLIPKGVDEWVKKFLLRALNPNPEHRATAQELLSLIPAGQKVLKQENQQSEFQQNMAKQQIKQMIKDEDLKDRQYGTKNTNQDNSEKQHSISQSQITASTNKPKGSEEITKILLHHIDYCRLQYEMLKMIISLKHKDQNFHKFVLKSDIDGILWLNVIQKFKKIQNLEFQSFSQPQIKEYKGSQEHLNIINIVQDYRSKYQENRQIIRRSNVKIKDSKQKINRALLWLYENVKINSPYQLFVLYDYLITLKWLFEIEEKQGIKQLCEVDMGDLVTALRRQAKARNKKILQDYLYQLESKLEQLNIITRA